MMILTTLLLLDVCFDCHRKEGSHRKDLTECSVCGWMGGSCCTEICCDASAYTCKKCGRASPANWPEGGKAVEGLRISIKPSTTPGEVVVKLTNTGEKEWSRSNHAYSHGGFEKHSYWTSGKLGNRDDVIYACPQELSHTSRTATLSLAAGASVVFKVKATGLAGEVPIRVTEFVLGAESNELRLKIGK